MTKEGCGIEFDPTHRNDGPLYQFECAKPNMLWSTDPFTFILKCQNRWVYRFGFMDAHRRFITTIVRW